MRVIAGTYQGIECTVFDGSETSAWFKIKSGVKQGCVMSGFLFLLVLDMIGPRGSRQEKKNTVEFYNGAGGS